MTELEMLRWMRDRPSHDYEGWCLCGSCARTAGWLSLGWLVFTIAMAALAIGIWRSV